LVERIILIGINKKGDLKMVKIKGWKKTKEDDKVIIYRTIVTKDYNINQPKHLQTKDSVFSVNSIKILKQWRMEDYPNWNNLNALWVVSDMKGMNKHFKTKYQAHHFAINYMRSHPNG